MQRLRAKALLLGCLSGDLQTGGIRQIVADSHFQQSKACFADSLRAIENVPAALFILQQDDPFHHQPPGNLLVVHQRNSPKQTALGIQQQARFAPAQRLLNGLAPERCPFVRNPAARTGKPAQVIRGDDRISKAFPIFGGKILMSSVQSAKGNRSLGLPQSHTAIRKNGSKPQGGRGAARPCYFFSCPQPGISLPPYGFPTTLVVWTQSFFTIGQYRM